MLFPVAAAILAAIASAGEGSSFSFLSFLESSFPPVLVGISLAAVAAVECDVGVSGGVDVLHKIDRMGEWVQED